MQSSLERAILNYKQLYTTGNPISSLTSGNAFDLTVNTLEFPHPELITIDVIGNQTFRGKFIYSDLKDQVVRPFSWVV